jgi:3'-phosphoadenosine 5'-phosphosulfate sulfotransferase (PAPS reductase)/FAD synthetase
MIRNPYRIDGPFVVSFSGGRTSAFMLAKIIDAHGGTFPPDGLVVFANTGREHSATLEFVRECAIRFGIAIHWIEYDTTTETKYRVCDFDTASRNGEPFLDMMRSRRMMPTPLRRLCTQWLKVEPIAKYAKSLGWNDATLAVGLRADEPRRVHRVAGTERNGFDYVCPMAEAGHTIDDVRAYWRASDFDLALPDDDRAFGNCDLCFLKGKRLIERVLRREPERAQWWIDAEREFGRTFRDDRATYAQMLVQVRIQPELFTRPDENDPEESQIPCTCTD